MAWHLGYPLSQTLFTSVYLEGLMMPAPETISDAYFTRNSDDLSHNDPMLLILRAYCLGLLKACWYVNERIKFEHYYEVRCPALQSISARSVLNQPRRRTLSPIPITARSLTTLIEKPSVTPYRTPAS